MKNINRSPLFYVGDKYKLIEEIKQYFPKKIRHFVEPFVGGGSVYLNVDAEDFWLNDLSYYVVSLHKLLCSFVGRKEEFFSKVFEIIDRYGLSCSARGDSAFECLKIQYPKTYFAQFNKQAFLKLREDYNSSSEKDCLMLYVLLIYGFNRMIRFNQKGAYNLPVGNVDFNQNTVEALNSYFRLNATKKTHWHNEDFEIFINRLNLSEQDLVYLDPPYLITFSEYNKFWTYREEQRLIDILDSLDRKHIKFAVSNVLHYKTKTNEIFLNWSAKYNVHSIKSNYISYHDNTIKKFNEVLVTNF